MATKRDDPCRDRVADDEPIFTLRAQDRFSWETVQHWIRVARVHGVNKEKIEDALLVAGQIAAWQSEHPDKVKVPD